ncbi:MAG: tripartite tricarboxylate transporter substrate-binding protein, partial [Burkholderiales bacterium]
MAATIAFGAIAQDYPRRPIKIIVPFPAGGTADVLPRLLVERVSARLGQPVIVENRAGAGGIVGTAYVAKQPPDGYTWLFT